MGRLSAVARSARAQRSASRRGDSRAGRRARPKLGDLRGGRFARPWWREVGEQSLQTQAAQPWPGLPGASFCVAMVPSRGHSSHRSCAPWAGHWSARSERPRLAPQHPPLFPLPHAGTRTGPSGTVGASEKEPVLTRGARSLLLTEGGGTEQRTLVETAWGRGAAPGPLLLRTREKAELRGHPDRPGGPRRVPSWWPFRVGRG